VQDDEALWKSVSLFSSTDVQTNDFVIPPSLSTLEGHLLSSSLDNSKPPAHIPLSPSAPLPGLVSSFRRSSLHRSVGYRESRPSVQKWKPKSYGYKHVWKPNKTKHRLIMGSDVGLEESVCLSLCGLVGRISYRTLCKCSLPDWITGAWLPLLGYVPEIISLSHGWFGLLFNSPEDSQCILDSL
jgi:hypothetical protein